MSTPPFLDLPAGVTAELVATARGPFATLRADADQATPALLVPGFTGSKEDFIAILAPVADAGVPVVAIDLAGQYQSPAASSGYSLPAFAADVLAVAESVGGGRPVHLVGHSFGGLVARQAVLESPGAFASLSLMSCGPAAVPDGQRDRLALFAQVLTEHGLEVVWAAKRALEEQEGGAGTNDPALLAFLDERFLANDPASLLAMVDVLTTEPDRVAELAAVAPRTLVVFGDDDDAWAPDAQREMAARLHADVAEIAGAGHSPAADQPGPTAAALCSFWCAG